MNHRIIPIIIDDFNNLNHIPEVADVVGDGRLGLLRGPDTVHQELVVVGALGDLVRFIIIIIAPSETWCGLSCWLWLYEDGDDEHEEEMDEDEIKLVMVAPLGDLVCFIMLIMVRNLKKTKK